MILLYRPVPVSQSSQSGLCIGIRDIAAVILLDNCLVKYLRMSCTSNRESNKVMKFKMFTRNHGSLAAIKRAFHTEFITGLPPPRVSKSLLKLAPKETTPALGLIPSPTLGYL